MAGGTLTLLLGAVLLAVPAAVLPALLRVRGPVAYALAALVTAAAVVVGVSTATSVVDSYTPAGVLLGQALVAVAAVALWLRAGRPLPPRLPRPSPRAALAFARTDPVLAGFAAIAAAALGIQLVQALSVVSNGWDPLAYHLARAAYWIQHQSVGHFEGGTPRQLGYPPNAEMMTAWTMLLLRGDRFANAVQFTALLGTGLAIVGGARVLRFPRRGAVLAALLFMTMPIPIMQAATSQNDLVAGFFVLAGTVLLVRGLRDGHRGELATGVTALALGVGTKGIVVVAGPSIALIVAAMAWRLPAARRALPAAIAMGVAALVLFAAYNFVLNLNNTGDLYGNARQGIARQAPLLDNAVRVHWGFADLPGVEIPWVQDALRQRAPDVLGSLEGPARFEYRVDTAADDSRSGFGPVAALFLLPALIAFAVGWRAPPARRLAAWASLLFLALFPLAAEYDPDLFRVALPGIALGAPLLAALHRWPGVAGLAVGASLLTLGPCVLANPYRPIVRGDDGPPAWDMPREDQFGIFRPEVAAALRRLDELTDDDATLGFAGSEHNAWDYPFFGPRLERRLVRIGDPARLTAAQMRERGLDAAVYEQVPPPPGLRTEVLGEPAVLLVLPEPAPAASRSARAGP